MIYLWAYLATGVVVAIWLYVAKFMNGPTPSWVDKLAQPHPDDPPPAKPTMAKRIGAQLLRYAVAITIWPVMVLILLEDKLNIGSGARVPERVFAVKRADLLETLTVEQIEARERVQDPLGAVPNLPFGPPVRLTSPTGMGHGHPGSSGELGGFQNGQTSFYFA